MYQQSGGSCSTEGFFLCTLIHHFVAVEMHYCEESERGEGGGKVLTTVLIAKTTALMIGEG